MGVREREGMSTLASHSTGSMQPVIDLKQDRGWRAWQIAGALLLLLWWLGDLHAMMQFSQPRLVAFLVSTLLVALGLRVLWHAHNAADDRGRRLGLILLFVFLPEHLGGSGRPFLQQVAPTLTVTLWIAFEPRLRVKLDAVREGRMRSWAEISLPIYFVVGTALAIWKLHCFGYVGQDVAYFMQCLYSGIHGHLFWANQYHDLLYSQPVYSDFAGHNQPVLFLLAMVYAIMPHAEILFVARNLLLTLAAIPTFRILRLQFEPVPSAVLTAGFMLAPAFLFQSFYDFAPLSLIAIPLLFTLLFYLRFRFLAFSVMLMACLLVREDLVIALLGLALVAAIQKRSSRWVLTPGLMGLAWAWISWHLVMPHFLHGATSAVQSCFAYLGSTPADILVNAARHPSLLITHNTVSYMKEMLSPSALVLPLFSPLSLISAPFLAINILGDRGCDAAIVFRHYALIPAIFLLPCIGPAWRSSFRLKCLGNYSQTSFSFLLLAASILTSVLSFGPDELAWFHAPSWGKEARATVNTLPPLAAVAVPRYMLPLVANRDLVYQSARLLQYHHPDAQFVVIDRDASRMGVSPHVEDLWLALQQKLADQTTYRLLSESANYLIYERVGDPPVSLQPDNPSR